TGSTISGRPAMGAWLSYGLGSESADLPGFVVLTSTGRYGQSQPIAARQWHSGFLPSRFQGVHLRSTGDPVLYLSRPAGVDEGRRGGGAGGAGGGGRGAGGRRGGGGRGPQPPARPRRGRPGDFHADRAVRDGLPDADERPAAARLRRRAAADPGPVRHARLGR